MFLSTAIISVFPTYLVRVEFDVTMDVSVTPALASFLMVFDGVPFAPTTVSWFDSTHLDVGLMFGPDPAVGVLQLIAIDPNLRAFPADNVSPVQEIQWKP